jgi:hypothetical protein
MTAVLIFVFLYILVSMWDVMHVNDLLAKMIDPGRRPARPEPKPAPRLDINLPPSSESDSSSFDERSTD